jgi:hypothetical protein
MPGPRFLAFYLQAKLGRFLDPSQQFIHGPGLGMAPLQGGYTGHQVTFFIPINNH